MPSRAANRISSNDYNNDSNNNTRINWFATLSHQDNRHQIKRIVYHPRTLRGKHLAWVLLDTSASMLGNSVLTTTLGIVKGLCASAYVRRHYFTVTHFGNDKVLTLFHPRRAPKNIETDLLKLKAGGGTPLRKGLLNASQRIANLRKEYSSQTLYLFTDGRTRENIEDVIVPCQTIIIDTEHNAVPLGKCKHLAARLNATYIHIKDITNDA